MNKTIAISIILVILCAVFVTALTCERRQSRIDRKYARIVELTERNIANNIKIEQLEQEITLLEFDQYNMCEGGPVGDGPNDGADW